MIWTPIGTDFPLLCVIRAISLGVLDIPEHLEQHEILICRQLSHGHGPSSSLSEDAVSLRSSRTKPIWKKDGEGHGAMHSFGIYIPELTEQVGNLLSKGKVHKEISHPCSFEGL